MQFIKHGHKSERFNANSRNNDANRSYNDSSTDGASNSSGLTCTKCTLKGHVAASCYTNLEIINLGNVWFTRVMSGLKCRSRW